MTLNAELNTRAVVVWKLQNVSSYTIPILELNREFNGGFRKLMCYRWWCAMIKWHPKKDFLDLRTVRSGGRDPTMRKCSGWDSALRLHRSAAPSTALALTFPFRNIHATPQTDISQTSLKVLFFSSEKTMKAWTGRRVYRCNSKPFLPVRCLVTDSHDSTRSSTSRSSNRNNTATDAMAAWRL